MKVSPHRPRVDLATADAALRQMEDPHLLWQYSTEDKYVSAPVPGPSGDLFISSGAGEWRGTSMGAIHSLEPSGELNWKFPMRASIMSAPVVWKDRVYAASAWGNLYAIDAESGEQIWQAPKVEGDFRTSPAIDDQGNVYGMSFEFKYFERGVATPVATVSRYSAESGRPEWTKTFTNGMNVDRAAPVAGPDNSLLVSVENSLVCLDQDSGEERWRFPLGGRGGRPIFFEDQILLGSQTNDDEHLVWSLTLDGKKQWQFQSRDTLGSHIPELAVDEKTGRLFVGDWGKSVFCLDARSGEEKWTRQPGGYGAFIPAVGGDDEVYFAGGRSEEFHVFDAENGESRWNFASKSRLARAPLHLQDNVYISADGKLVALAEDALERRLDELTLKRDSIDIDAGENRIVVGDFELEVR